MYESGKIIQTLYETVAGRFLLKIGMKLRLDLLAVRFLHSPCSKHMIRWFVRVNRIETTLEEIASCSSFRDRFGGAMGRCARISTQRHAMQVSVLVKNQCQVPPEVDTGPKGEEGRWERGARSAGHTGA